MYSAASFNRLEIVKYLHGREPEVYISMILQRAALHCHMDVVQWMYEHRAGEVDVVNAMYAAAKRGN